MEQIYSKDNKLYKILKKLSKKKYRDENNLFLAEGEKFFSEVKKVNRLIISESQYEYYEANYDLSKYDRINVLSDNLFKELSTQEHSQGVMFVISKASCELKDISGDLVILDEVQDPGNAGTIIRTLVATGYKNLVLTNNSVDVFNPKTVRSSMGAIFKLNIIYSSREEIKKFLLDNEYSIYATALDENSIDYRNINLTKDRNAYIFGHEGGGISKELLDISRKVIIPMTNQVNSLNVGVSVAVFLYKMRELENFFKL